MGFEPPPILPPDTRGIPLTPPPVQNHYGLRPEHPPTLLGSIWQFFEKHKFLLTGLTMFASVWFYSVRFGWWFALLFVLGILIHELGHVVTSLYVGVPVSAPIFIPGFGALIIQKKLAPSAWGEALIGIGGPLGGTFVGLIYWGLFIVTGKEIFVGVALLTFALNLFNMVPIFPLDGGRIVGAVSPYLWLLGLVAMGALAYQGFIQNPVIWVIIFLSIPHVINGIKRGTADPIGGQVTTKKERVVMGISYVTLSCFLCAALLFSAANQSKWQLTGPERNSSQGQPI